MIDIQVRTYHKKRHILSPAEEKYKNAGEEKYKNADETIYGPRVISTRKQYASVHNFNSQIEGKNKIHQTWS